LHLAERLAHVASALVPGSLNKIEVDLWGVDDGLHVPITVAALKGALSPFLGEAVNYVNAERIAQGRGIGIERTVHSESADYPHLVGLRLGSSQGSVEIVGTLFHGHDPRVVAIEGFQLEFRPKGKLVVLRNDDVPGVVGQVGTTLGDARVNIAEIHLSRQSGSTEALAVVRLDQRPDPQVLDLLRALPAVRSVEIIDLD
jgi:L-serine deaminase